MTNLKQFGDNLVMKILLKRAELSPAEPDGKPVLNGMMRMNWTSTYLPIIVEINTIMQRHLIKPSWTFSSFGWYNEYDCCAAVLDQRTIKLWFDKMQIMLSDPDLVLDLFDPNCFDTLRKVSKELSSNEK